jgi:hypothetical protein
VSGEWYELIWPLDKRHYLSPSLRESDIMSTASSELTSANRRDPVDDPVDELTPIPTSSASSPSRPSTTGRDLAGRALLAGCSKPRTRDLLGVSSRTVGRIADADLTDAWHDADALEQARTCLAETADRGSTAEEREAAEVWLRETMRDARHVERGRSKAASRRPRVAPVTRHGPVHRPPRNGRAMSAQPQPAPSSNGARPQPATAFEEIDELRRLQQRILHGSTLVRYVLAAEQRSGQTLTMGEALAERLADVADAANKIGTLLEHLGADRSRPAMAR